MTKTGDPTRSEPSTPQFSGTVSSKDRHVASVVGSSGMTYRPIRDLGEGGTARAVLAQAIGAGGFSKLVVLKILHPQLAEEQAARDMFEQEARLSARLNHPNLVQVQEVVDSDAPFLVMEYLDGKPLSRVLAIGGMTQAMLLTIVAEALIGLHHAHELCDFDGQPLNIVHRDISPHNIFITYDGAVKVLDFGIAKAAGGGQNTETGEVKGKLAYMAPEQLLGRAIDRRSDIFAAGCILWEAAVGSRIWGEMSDGAVMHRLATGEIPRPDGHTGMGPVLEAIVGKATATSPDQRYQTALELQQELSAFIDEQWGGCSVRHIGSTLAEIFREDRERTRKILGAALADSSASLSDTSASQSKSGQRPTVAMPSAIPSPLPPPPRSSRWWVPVAFALLTLLVAAGVWAKRGAVVKDVPPPVEPAHPVHVVLRTTPSEATIQVDGRDRGVAPLVLEVWPDTLDHALRVSAPGYATEDRTLKFARDLEVDIALERVAAPKHSAPQAAAVAPVPAPAPAQAHGGMQQAVTAPMPKPMPKPTAATPSAASEPSCSPPYYFSNGIKLFKPECL